MITNAADLIGPVAAIAGWVWAVVEKVKSTRKDKRTAQERQLVSDSKMHQERANTMKKTAEDNLHLYKQEHEEHIRTREYWHSKANEYQVTLSECQMKLAEERSRPDLQAMLLLLREQNVVSGKILARIESIAVTISAAMKQQTHES